MSYWSGAGEDCVCVCRRDEWFDFEREGENRNNNYNYQAVKSSLSHERVLPNPGNFMSVSSSAKRSV